MQTHVSLETCKAPVFHALKAGGLMVPSCPFSPSPPLRFRLQTRQLSRFWLPSCLHRPAEPQRSEAPPWIFSVPGLSGCKQQKPTIACLSRRGACWGKGTLADWTGQCDPGQHQESKCQEFFNHLLEGICVHPFWSIFLIFVSQSSHFRTDNPVGEVPW